MVAAAAKYLCRGNFFLPKLISFHRQLISANLYFLGCMPRSLSRASQIAEEPHCRTKKKIKRSLHSDHPGVPTCISTAKAHTKPETPCAKIIDKEGIHILQEYPVC
jgi:hypothetical protein